MTKKLVLLFFTVAAMSACSLFGKQGVDIAPYSVLKADGAIEIREYRPLVIAKTSVVGDYDSMGDVAFDRLFKYISGNNEKQSKIAMTAPVLQNKNQGEKIAMTAPVLMRAENETWTMSFVLPQSYTVDTAPQPKDKTIKIETIDSRTLAVIRFSEFMNAKNRKLKTEELQKWLVDNGYESIGQPVIAGYDPPWTLPMFRRNEIQIAIK